MQRALLLGQNCGSGLSLHGRTLRISEASGPASLERDRERTRSRSTDGRHRYASSDLSVGTGQSDFLSPTYPVPFAPLSPSPTQSYRSSNSGLLSPRLRNPLSPPLSAGVGWRGEPVGSPLLSPSILHAHAQALAYSGAQQQSSQQQSHSSDSNNTTVFVGGLPACINEDTLKVSVRIRHGRKLRTDDLNSCRASFTILGKSLTAKYLLEKVVASCNSFVAPMRNSLSPK